MSSAKDILKKEDAGSRAICYDDSSMDFLDNRELQCAFQAIEEQTGKRVSLIGMDACLMSMIEVAHQLRAHADYLIGSQALEPMAGWPYTPILSTLAATPDMTAKDLAKSVVREYGAAYDTRSRGGRRQITQAAVNLAAIEPLMEKLKPLSKALTKALKEKEREITNALFYALRYAVRLYEDSAGRVQDYVDLYDLLAQFKNEYVGDDQELVDAVNSALALMEEDARPQVVVENVTLGSEQLSRAKGLSIYLPERGYSEFYDGLDFAESGWGDFIRTLNGVE